MAGTEHTFAFTSAPRQPPEADLHPRSRSWPMFGVWGTMWNGSMQRPSRCGLRGRSPTRDNYNPLRNDKGYFFFLHSLENAI